jgi:ribonuclease D
MAGTSNGGLPRRPYSGRSRHRSDSHNNAHADASLDSASSHHDHPLATHAPPQLITQPKELAELIDHLRAAGSFAYDSEFIGELTYIPKLCLIQAATTQRVALIDPLAKLDLTPFWELLADASVEKIVHAGAQDIEPVHRAIGRPAANLFDAQIAAGFVGLAYPLSLSKLVFALVGAKLGKGLTFTHWDHRPLTNFQLGYAADDVRYLPAARHELRLKLDALGSAAWAREESEALADPSRYGFDPQSQYLKIRGASSLSARNMAILRELTILRDRISRDENVPPRSLLKDEVLLDLARTPARALNDLARIRGLPRPVEQSHGPAIIQATETALSMPEKDLPAIKNHEPIPADKFRADALWCAAQCVCAGQQIDAALVTNRNEIGEFYRLLASGEDPSQLDVMKGWRRDVLGNPLRILFAGGSRLHLQWDQGSMSAKSEALA